MSNDSQYTHKSYGVTAMFAMKPEEQAALERGRAYLDEQIMRALRASMFQPKQKPHEPR